MASNTLENYEYSQIEGVFHFWNKCVSQTTHVFSYTDKTVVTDIAILQDIALKDIILSLILLLNPTHRTFVLQA